MAEKGIPSWPKVTIRLYDDHNAEVKIAGRSHPVNHHDPRQAAIALVAERSAQLGRAMKATAVESDGSSWPLIIHPDGQVEAVEVATKNDKPIWPIIAAAALAVVLVAGTALYLLVIRDHGPAKPTSTESPKLPELPKPEVKADQFAARPAPPGWSTNAAWTIDIKPDTHPAVSPDGSEVAVLTADQKLVVLDSAGKVIYQDKVPRDTTSPVYTTVDSKPVLAATAPGSLFYWPGDGAPPTDIELPDSAQVQFFGSSPLVDMGTEAGASVVTGGELQAAPNQPRLSTILLADGNRVLMARYAGPLYWSEPGKDLVTLQPKPPPGAKSIDHIVAASAGRVIVHWTTGKANEVIVSVNSTANGAVVATCPKVSPDQADDWHWLPDQAGKVASLGECLINFTSGKTSLLTQFEPQSVNQTTIYGQVGGDLVSVVPGSKLVKLQPNTARPWGTAGDHAIVVHDSVLYALDKK
ncbi:hypothetical protein F1D05_20135 [Kribbella qitaiheensis]|uniref:Uncharacterized protein n=1 Tax=Kribbella qitaiheensis TaxID=1544730 RepID=A0A7G6X0N6_9ACTN|nr:hypothetical protein [Kribbella qitaiheensis]QNE19801.1 hypothetical protein F1D05_20135 [Kribbella qitaiheensis]